MVFAASNRKSIRQELQGILFAPVSIPSQLRGNSPFIRSIMAWAGNGQSLEQTVNRGIGILLPLWGSGFGNT
jgi:hypothetical protein